MDKNTYKNLLDEAAKHLYTDSLLPALTTMETLASLLADWNITSRLNNIRRAYNALLTYFRSGAEDSGREGMYFNFVREADEVWCELHRNYLVDYTETAYAQTLRVLRHMESQSASESQFLSSDISPTTLFERIWTLEPLTESLTAMLREYLVDAGSDLLRRQIVISALSLAALEVFDPQKLRLLVECSRSEDARLRARAIVGMVLVFATHQSRALRYKDLSAAVKVHYDSAIARRELTEVQMQLLLSMETKQIARNLREDILPEMLKKTKGVVPTDPETLSRLNAEMAELGLNPDWEKDERRNEVGKKIRKLIEMQQKGADVYLSSFAMLKGRFPFFNHAANWFLPFSSDHPELRLHGVRRSFAETMARFGMLCESDKYSLALLIAQMPDAQFDMLRTQMEAMVPNTSELEEPETTFTAVLRTTLQDFYRFATLFRHGHSALNPFRRPLFLSKIEPFRELIGYGESLQQIATFAFDEGNYTVALPLIMQLIEAEPTARLWQMAGYCHQRAGHFDEAITAYDRSGLFGEQSAWTIRQLAACHRAAGHYAEALGFYEQMAVSQSDDIALLVRRAQCLQEIGRTDEALELLHKADYLEEVPAEGTRTLMRVLYRAGKFDSALSTARRLLAADPVPADRLLAAHAAWLSGDVSEAVALYKGYYTRLEPSARAEHHVADLLFGEDRDFLLQNGKTQVDLQIMADATAEMQD